MMNFHRIKHVVFLVGILVLIGLKPYKVTEATTTLMPQMEGVVNDTINVIKEERIPLTAVLPGRELKVIKEDNGVVTLPKTTIAMSRGGLPPQRVLSNCQVTWYNNEGISYTTKSGTRTVDGLTVAVDPSVIPLGTWMEIYMPDGTMYKRRAEDTGSAVKGKIVDIYADVSTKELYIRGRTHGVTVIIIGG